MAGSRNLTGILFSKYFPNNLEYASQVPREYRPPKRPRLKPDKQPKPLNLSAWPQESFNITPEKKPSIEKEEVFPTGIRIEVESSVTRPTQTDERSKPEDQFLIDTHKKYPQTDQETQTNPSNNIKTTQTEIFEIRRIDSPDPDARKYDYLEPFPLTEQDKHQNQKYPSPEPSSSDETSPRALKDESSYRAWNDMICKEDSKPRMVVSVIGFYNQNIPNYKTKDELVIEEALRDVSKYVGRCGFLFNERNTGFVHRVVKLRYPISDIPTTLYGFTAADKIKTQHDSSNPENLVPESSDYNKPLLDLEIYINKQITINFQDDGKEKVRVPVVLLLVNGDLFSLEHVVRALFNDISVIVIKGTGGAADLIASCLDSPKCLKRMSVKFKRRFSEHMYQKLENVIHSILERDYMITVFGLHKQSPTTLWEEMTDGIMLAWSFEKQPGMYSDESNKKPFGTENIFGVVGETIPKYIVNIELLSKNEIFGGYNIRSKDVKLQKVTDEILIEMIKNQISTSKR